jgi:diamine N-acetyltransferase
VLLYAAAMIRTAVPEDAGCIVAIEQVPEFRSYIGSWNREEHLSAMADPDNEYLVLCGPDGAVDGFAILQNIRSEHRNLYLKRIAVETVNRGGGRALLEHAMARAFRHHGAHRLWLDVFETNARARHVYRTCGFREDGVLREAIFRDGKYHSLLLMSVLDREYEARQQESANAVTLNSAR